MLPHGGKLRHWHFMTNTEYAEYHSCNYFEYFAFLSLVEERKSHVFHIPVRMNITHKCPVMQFYTWSSETVEEWNQVKFVILDISRKCHTISYMQLWTRTWQTRGSIMIILSTLLFKPSQKLLLVRDGFQTKLVLSPRLFFSFAY